jgi:hypothetical protein
LWQLKQLLQAASGTGIGGALSALSTVRKNAGLGTKS